MIFVAWHWRKVQQSERFLHGSPHPTCPRHHRSPASGGPQRSPRERPGGYENEEEVRANDGARTTCMRIQHLTTSYSSGEDGENTRSRSSQKQLERWRAAAIFRENKRDRVWEVHVGKNRGRTDWNRGSGNRQRTRPFHRERHFCDCHGIGHLASRCL